MIDEKMMTIERTNERLFDLVFFSFPFSSSIHYCIAVIPASRLLGSLTTTITTTTPYFTNRFYVHDILICLPRRAFFDLDSGVFKISGISRSDAGAGLQILYLSMYLLVDI